MSDHTCSWPTCLRRISGRDAFCYKHWLAIPPEERYERVRLAMEEHKQVVDAINEPLEGTP